MTPVELDALADKVADRLGGSMVSSALPAHVGPLLREYARYGSYENRFIVAGPTANAIMFHTKITAAGELHVDIEDMNGQRLWTGTFRAIEEKP